MRAATALGLIEGVSAGPQQVRETLVYNESSGPARNTDLKVTPLKIDQLIADPDSSTE